MRLRLVLLVGLVLALGSMTAAGWAGYGRTTVHDDLHGPLSATSGHGGGYAAAREGVWYLAFAGNLLCLTDDGKPVTITGVRFDVQVPPRKLRTLVRTVSPKDAREARSGTLIGTAAYTRPAGRDREFTGTFSEGVAGTVVEQPCSAKRASGNGIPHDGFQDLVFELEVGPRGALVPRAYVDYTRGRRSYTLVVNWEMGACSRLVREISDGEFCTSP